MKKDSRKLVVYIYLQKIRFRFKVEKKTVTRAKKEEKYKNGRTLHTAFNFERRQRVRIGLLNSFFWGMALEIMESFF